MIDEGLGSESNKDLQDLYPLLLKLAGTRLLRVCLVIF
jgi:hypothetical protein